jgi:hypothetical protein
MSVNLYELINKGYKNHDEQKNYMNSKGYFYDEELSNKKSQVYYNPDKHELIKNINGTQTLSDIATDGLMSIGLLKDTKFYDEQKNNLELARKKYNEPKIKLSGHSLGASTAHAIASPSDEVYALNMFTSINQPIRKNTKHYRDKFDVVSLFNTNAKHTENLNSRFNSILKNHSSNTIKNKNIMI